MPHLPSLTSTPSFRAEQVLINCTKESAAPQCAPPDRRLFGVPLPLLMADGRVPTVLEKLVSTLELRGLYTEGLYRKSAVSRRVKHLRDELEEHLDEVRVRRRRGLSAVDWWEPAGDTDGH